MSKRQGEAGDAFTGTTARDRMRGRGALRTSGRPQRPRGGYVQASLRGSRQSTGRHNHGAHQLVEPPDRSVYVAGRRSRRRAVISIA